MGLTYNQFLSKNKTIIDQKMIAFLKDTSQSKLLLESMLYSLNAGGKRFRPLLLLSTIVFFRKELTVAHYQVAASLEMVHTYSLIHDDLPAMDDDDLRRGAPTNHIVYGEALAILSGDALLTEAFHMITLSEIDAQMKVEIMRLLAKASGSNGMIAGQVEDVFGEGKKISLKELQGMHYKKTGALIECAVEAGAVLCDSPKEVREYLIEYAKNLGIAFQIKDDLLDVIGEEKLIGKKTGADQKHDKNTYVSLLGIDGAKEALEKRCHLAKRALRQAKQVINHDNTKTYLELIIDELKVMP